MSELKNDFAVPSLELVEVSVEFGVGRRAKRRGANGLRAVDRICLSIAPGETLGLVGESGSGKSTTARVAAGLQQPTGGAVRVAGQQVGTLRHRGSALRRAIQTVFQDPSGSLDQRQRVGAALAEPLLIHRICERKEFDSKVSDLLTAVGLDPAIRDRYPYQLSGGQRQRVAIARALALSPQVVICDEPVSALDASVQAQIINQLIDLQESLGVGYLFVAHDLAVVRHIAHRVAIMYRGRIIETGETDSVYQNPRHPYTVALLSSVLDPTDTRKRAARIDTSADIGADPVAEVGCHFRDRCALYRLLDRPAKCSLEQPEPLADGRYGEHLSECHYPTEVTRLNRAVVPAVQS